MHVSHVIKVTSSCSVSRHKNNAELHNAMSTGRHCYDYRSESSSSLLISTRSFVRRLMGIVGFNVTRHSHFAFRLHF